MLINACLKLTLTYTEIDEIEVGFAKWVERYERFVFQIWYFEESLSYFSIRIYYQYDETRLAICTLPIHALLHIANDIRYAGPVWCYWAFVMEQFCGSLLPAVKSRKHPYSILAHHIRDIAQLSQLKVVYHLEKELDLS